MIALDTSLDALTKKNHRILNFKLQQIYLLFIQLNNTQTSSKLRIIRARLHTFTFDISDNASHPNRNLKILFYFIEIEYEALSIAVDNKLKYISHDYKKDSQAQRSEQLFSSEARSKNKVDRSLQFLGETVT